MSDLATTLLYLRDKERTPVTEVPALYLPWVQRALNPFPLASSGQAFCEMGQPWPVLLLAFTVSVFVQTTNNATNFWTINLISTAGVVLATFTTAAITVATWTRVSVTSFTQPLSTNADMAITLTATLAPGPIFCIPALALVRTGN